jgi:hypothetical protein
VKHLDQINIGSELFLKEKKKQDIVKDLKMAFGDNIVSIKSLFHIFTIPTTPILFRDRLTTRRIVHWYQNSNVTYLNYIVASILLLQHNYSIYFKFLSHLCNKNRQYLLIFNLNFTIIIPLC